MTSISSNFLLISALSSITLNAGILNSLSVSRTDDVLPSILIEAEMPLHFEDYSIKEFSASNETTLPERTLVNEYNILASFANKMLSEESQIDSEIQNIIDEHFWDML